MDLAQIFKKTFSGFDAVGKTQVSDSALTRTTAINVATPNPMTGPVGSPTATRPPGSTSAEEEEPLVDVESPPLDATSLVPLSVVCPDDEARLMEEMYISCEDWIMETWNIDLKVIKIIRNPWVRLHVPVGPASQALARFRKALVEHSLNMKDLEYIFGWHGTEEANIDGICREGYNPACRRGQQYGRGEYFGITSTASYGYCKGGSFLIATLIINGDWVSPTNAVNAYLVNNAETFAHTYCLPLCVVNFGSCKEAPFADDAQPLEYKVVTTPNDDAVIPSTADKK